MQAGNRVPSKVPRPGVLANFLNWRSVGQGHIGETASVSSEFAWV